MEILYRFTQDELWTLVKEDVWNTYLLQRDIPVLIEAHYHHEDSIGGFDYLVSSFLKDLTKHQIHYDKSRLAQLTLNYLLGEDYLHQISHVTYSFVLSPAFPTTKVTSYVLGYFEVTVKEPLQIE